MPRRAASALEQLIARHRQALVRFLTRRLGSVEDAQEIAQDAFVRILRLQNADEIDNARAFLYQVASNLAVDQLRRRSLHARFVAEEDASARDGGEPAGVATPEDLVAAREQLSRMYEAIDRMPLRPRQALMLHRLKGLSYAEIAREMQVSVSSVEKYILEALKFLRHMLDA